MRSKTILFAALALSATPLAGQEGAWPEGWEARFDRPAESRDQIEFVAMEPGWHVKTGPAAILYDPARSAEGEYRIRATFVDLDPDRSPHAEAYGLFFGGRDLQGAEQRYSYFLIRETGEYLVKRRVGRGTDFVLPWLPSPAIAREPAAGAGVENELVVEFGAESVDFYINGTKVRTVPRAKLDADGIVGLRINHRLDLHISEFAVEPLTPSGD
jgi:hypothetical protein